MSACWMTLILLTISFLVFYALGLSAYRRQPVVVFKCNNSKPASDVYFHYITSRSQNILPRFSELLSTMATQYANLRFNVYFLINDSQSGNRTRFLKELVPAFPRALGMIIDQNNKIEIRDFQMRYQNVNITVMSLTKYMARTPLKFVWRSVPLAHLPFYARIFSIWQNGGIGFDLATLNYIHNTRQDIHPKIKAILKQHNDGIEIHKYVSILNSIDVENENKILSSIINLINHVLNQTSMFFDAEVTPEVKIMDYTPLIRTHRSKRGVEEDKSAAVSVNGTSNVRNTTKGEIRLLKNVTADANATNNTEKNSTSNSTLPKNELLPKLENRLPFSEIKSQVSADFPEMSIFYYFTAFDDIESPYSLPFVPIKTGTSGGPMKITEFKKLAKQGKQLANHLSISSDGLFIAAVLRYHPFLAQLFSTGCKKVDPKIAIDDTFMKQCSVFVKDNVYCDNIHIISSIL